MRSITMQRECDATAFSQARLEGQQAIDLLTAARHAMSEFYMDNGIMLGHLQGSVTRVFVPQVPGLANSEGQAPDSDLSHRCAQGACPKTASPS